MGSGLDPKRTKEKSDIKIINKKSVSESVKACSIFVGLLLM